MRRFANYAVVVTFLAGFNSYGQTWEMVYGEPGINTWANNINVAANGDILAAGYHDNAGMHLLRADIPTGMPVLDIGFVYAGGGEGFSAFDDAAGDIYTAGAVWGSALGNSDAYLTKVNAAGVLDYAAVYGTAGNERGNHAILAGNDVVICGETDLGDDDVMLVRVDGSDGSLVWGKTYDIGQQDIGWNVRQVGANFIVTGLAKISGQERSFLMLVDGTNGDPIWCRTYHSGLQTWATSVEVLPGGDYVVAGRGGGPGGDELIVMRIDATTQEAVWTTSLDGMNFWVPFEGIDVILDSQGDLVIAVETTVNPIQGTSDGCLVKLDVNGNFIWARQYASSNTSPTNADGFHGVAEVVGCGYVVSGWYAGVVGGPGTNDYVLNLTDMNGQTGCEGNVTPNIVSLTTNSSSWTPTHVSNVLTANVTTQTTTFSSTLTQQATCAPSTADWMPPDTLCEAAGIVDLAPFVIGTAGGTFTGPGMTGTNFDPSGFSGNVTITYTVGTGPCAPFQDQDIYIKPDVDPSWNPPASLCETAGPDDLSAYITGTTGGTFTGTGVTGNMFDPTGLSGAISITYTVGSGLCQETEVHSINVIAGPDASWTSPGTICEADGVIDLSTFITGTTGGNFTGTGVTSPNFDPAGQTGAVSVTYTVGTAPCTASEVQTITVIEQDDPSWNPPATICESAAPIDLSTFITGTTGGNFTGLGVTGNMFDPSGLSGNISITYTVGSAPCEESEVQIINVTASPDASWTSPGTICEADGIIDLTPFITGTGGGVFSGPGVTDPDFDPAGQSGAVSITYTVGTAPCADSQIQTITVIEQDDPSWNPPATICQSSLPLDLSTLITGTTGGSFSGPGVTGNNFNPGGPGTVTVTYTVGTAPCEETEAHVIDVITSPDASWTSPGTICEADGVIDLSTFVTGTPGGNFTGTGVTSPNFDPTGLSGTISVTYTVGTAPCTDSQAQNIVVIEQDDPSWNAPATICQSSLPLDLSTLITGTTGGTFSGPGVTGNNFNPGGPGAVTVTYTVGTAPCEETEAHTINVITTPDASWTSPGTVCESVGIIDLSTFVTGTSGGTFSGPGVTSPNFDPTGQSGPISITYTVGTAPCTDAQSQNITVDPAVNITSSGADMCVGETRPLTATPGGGSWNIVSGPGSLAGSTLTATGAGVITIEYTAGSCTDQQVINVNAATAFAFTDSICGTYFLPSGGTATSPGTYQDTIANAAGCDSVLTITLIPGNGTEYLQPTIAACDSVEYNSVWYTSSATDTTIYTTAGCDSIVIQPIVINYATTFSFTDSICGSYTLPSGGTVTGPGTYMDTITNAAGCDSVLAITLVPGSGTEYPQPAISACDSVLYNSTWYTSSDIDTTVYSTAGCDSIVIQPIVINYATSFSFTDSICGTYFFPGGGSATSPGTYMDTIPNAAGCDSVLTITLIPGSGTEYPQPPISACDSVLYNSTWYTSSGIDTTVYSTSGCDSIVIQPIVINYATSFSFTDSICGTYSLPGGGTATSPGTYMDTITNAAGCDSVLTITLIPGSGTEYPQPPIAACDSLFFNGTWYTGNGVDTTIYSTAACDSIVIQPIVINYSTTFSFSDSICGTYLLPSGDTASAPGTYLDTISNAVGCDSVITITLVPGSGTVYNQTPIFACDSAQYNSVWHFTSTVDTTVYATAACDSIVVQPIFINYSSTHSFSDSICGSYVLPDGNTVTSPGTYIATIPNTVGCDSVITVQLFQGSPNMYPQGPISGCDSLFYNGTWYFSSTVVTTTYTTAGCDSVIVQPIVIDMAPTNTINVTLCDGDTYTSSSGTTYSAAGTYTEFVTNPGGCDSLITIQINVMPNPVVSISGDTVLCEGEWTQLTAQGGASYVWSTGDTTATISVAPGSNTTYSVVATVGNCSDSAQANVVVNPMPTPTVTAESTLLPTGESTIITATGGVSYNWMPSTWLDCSTCPVVEATPEEPTTYCVHVTSAQGCTEMACVFIDVKEDCSGLFIPNAFSPNGDGNNDELCVYGGDCMETMVLQIFNRWGEKVFETSNQGDCWDGTFRGKAMNNAVFVYRFSGYTYSGEWIEKSGNISLIK